MNASLCLVLLWWPNERLNRPLVVWVICVVFNEFGDGATLTLDQGNDFSFANACRRIIERSKFGLSYFLCNFCALLILDIEYERIICVGAIVASQDKDFSLRDW